MKIIFGMLVAAGLVIGFFERWFAPHSILMESSPNFPNWLGWVGWVMASVAAIGYVWIDIGNK